MIVALNDWPLPGLSRRVETLARKYGLDLTGLSRRMRDRPCTISVIVSSCCRMSFKASAAVPTLWMPAKPGSSCSSSICAARPITFDLASDSSRSWRLEGRPIPRGIIVPGKTNVPRTGRIGNCSGISGWPNISLSSLTLVRVVAAAGLRFGRFEVVFFFFFFTLLP